MKNKWRKKTNRELKRFQRLKPSPAHARYTKHFCKADQTSYPVFIASGIEVSGVLQTQKYLAVFCSWWLLSTPRETGLPHSRSKSTFHPLQTSSRSLCASQRLGPSVLLSRRGNWGWKCCPWAVEQVSVKVSPEISGCFTSLLRHQQGTPARAVACDPPPAWLTRPLLTLSSECLLPHHLPRSTGRRVFVI